MLETIYSGLALDPLPIDTSAFNGELTILRAYYRPITLCDRLDGIFLLQAIIA